MKKLLIIVLVVQSLVSVAGGGWSQKKGEGFFYLYERMIRGNQFFSNDGSITTIATSGVYFTSLYGEYGITDRLTVYGNAPLFVRATKNAVQYTSGLSIAGDEYNGVGDMDLAIKYGFFQDKPVVFAVSAWAGLPFGNPTGGDFGVLSTGDGEFNQMLRLDASGSFSSGIYATGYLGFNNRTGGFSDEIHFGGEVGYFKKPFFAVIKLIGLESRLNGSGPTSDSGIFSNNIEYLSYGPEIGYYFSDAVGVLAGIQGGFYAKNLIAAPSIQIGVFYDLKKGE